MNREWAASQLEDFIGAIDSLDQLQHIGNLIAGDESQTLKFEAESNEAENTVRSLEPIAQIIMEALKPGLSAYESADSADNWAIRWRPAKNMALRALGLVRSGAEAKEQLRPDAPDLVADQLHTWVWEAARPMWEAGSQSTAVLHATQAINARLQQKLGRFDISDASLCTEAFSTDPPKEGRSRLRFSGDRTSETWKSLQVGAGFFGRGCFQTIRNPLAHDHQYHLRQQDALEMLAALSLLARLIDECLIEAASKQA
jgi:uncharacterized protein (TIGR02391 family)